MAWLSRITWICPLLFLAACAHQPLPQPLPAVDPVPPPPEARVKSSDTTFITIPWRVTRGQTQPMSAGAVLHELTLTSLDEGDVRVRVVRFDRQQCSLRVVDQPDSDAGSHVLAQALRDVGALAGVNGGYFHPDFSPLGLVVSGGRSQGRLVRTSLVSGMVCVRDGRQDLVWNDEYREQSGVTDLLQCGPRLVDGGEPIAGLNATRTSARSFVATDGNGGWLIGVAEYTTLRGLSDLLATPGLIAGMRVERALNLDGGRSTSFYARTSDGAEINDPGWSTVRNYLAVLPR